MSTLTTRVCAFIPAGAIPSVMRQLVHLQVFNFSGNKFDGEAVLHLIHCKLCSDSFVACQVSTRSLHRDGVGQMNREKSKLLVSLNLMTLMIMMDDMSVHG